MREFTRELTTFDKINLAACAVKRAKAGMMDNDRFHGEFATAMLWKAHRVSRSTLQGKPWGYVTVA